MTSSTLRKRYRVGFGHMEVGSTARRLLQESMDRGWVSEGPHVEQFETGFARHFGYPHTVATSSGTDAGMVAMSTLFDRGAERGDEVITPALSFAASANCILAAGLIPRFVDVELATLNINPALIEAALTPRTRAIQVVHTMGRPCRMEDIIEIARANRLMVIEDCCESHGAQLGGRPVGSFGAMGTFSFYVAHLIAAGEGGMICTSDEELAMLCRSIRSHGRRGGERVFNFDRVGFNSKMNDLEAALGIEALEQFEDVFKIRRRYSLRLQALLSSLSSELIVTPDAPGELTSPHAFPLVLRDDQNPIQGLFQHLEERGVECKTLFGSLPTQHNAFSFLKYREGDFPVAERLGKTGLHFGIHQYLTQEDIEYVGECIHAYFK